MDHSNNYVLGRGRLYFDRFADGTKTKTGEYYFGNTPSLTVTQNATALDHYGSESGLKVKDASVTLQNDMTGAFSTDDVSADNLALWFLGDVDRSTIAAATAISETVTGVTLSRFYQLGVNDDTPQGTRNVDTVTVKSGPLPGTVVAMAGNYEVDLENGRIFIEPDATDIADGDDLIFTYDQAAYSREQVIGKGSQIYGALRFVSDNPVGGNKVHYYPYAKLTSNGDYALKGDDWQAMSFTLDVLQLNDTTQRVYIDTVTAPTA